ncbi:hypothetical protein B5S52_10980 [Pectobacterium brasiliense]|nr:hypothetical protein B5S52_10980 [Pectobacterium brasiliense]
MHVRWLRSVTRITYLSKLIGIPSLAAFLKLELFRVYILNQVTAQMAIPLCHRSRFQRCASSRIDASRSRGDVTGVWMMNSSTPKR